VIDPTLDTSRRRPSNHSANSDDTSTVLRWVTRTLCPTLRDMMEFIVYISVVHQQLAIWEWLMMLFIMIDKLTESEVYCTCIPV